MDFQLSEDQTLLKQAARDFCQKRVRPHAEEFDKHGALPQDLLTELAGLGYLGLLVPEEYGGLGLDTVSYVCVMEEFAQACASLEIVLSVLVALAGSACAGAAAPGSLRARVQVDASHSLGELPRPWRYFGADEPNYATTSQGKQLLAEMGYDTAGSGEASAETARAVEAIEGVLAKVGPHAQQDAAE